MANEKQNPQQPGGRPKYDEERPGYDVDVETEVPGRKNTSEPDRPGQGKSGMGWGQDQGQKPETDDATSRSRRPNEQPDDERQTKKRP